MTVTTLIREPAAKTRAGAKASPMAEVKTINLALQGGGAHGAFTWGVLDRLLAARAGMSRSSISTRWSGARCR